MAETRYQDLSPHDRRDALEVAERNSGQKAHLLEKDVWIVATLGVLFDAPFAGNLIFKGGTSLSKVWHAIRRFSEDIDITYDIRAFASDLVSGAGDEALPPTRSQEKRWTRAIRKTLRKTVFNVMVVRKEKEPSAARCACSRRSVAHQRVEEARSRSRWPRPYRTLICSSQTGSCRE